MVDQKLTKDYRHITFYQAHQANRLQLEIDNFWGKSFTWKKYHPLVNTQVKTLYQLSTKNKQEKDNQEDELHGERDYSPPYPEIKEGERQINESKAP